MRFDLDEPLELLVGRGGERALGEHAGIRDEQINAPEPLERERHRGIAGRAIGRIGRRKTAPVSRSSVGTALLVATAEDDLVAVRAQPAHDRRADSARAARDERRAAHRARSASTVFARSAARMPPSISRSAPVIVRASSLARNETAAATSRACTSRPSGGRVHSRGVGQRVAAGRRW